MPNNETPSQGFFGGLWDTVSGFFEAQASKIWSGFKDIFWSLIAEIGDKGHRFFDALGKGIWASQLTTWQQRGWIDNDTTQELFKLSELNFPANIFAYMVVTVAMLSTIVKQVLYTTSTDIKRALFKKYHPEDIQGQSVIPASFIDPSKTALITQILAQNGYPQEQIDLLFFAMQRLYDENTIRTLYFRKLLTEEQVYERMSNLGYKDERIEEIIKTWPVIPSVSDILFMVKKEAFRPDIIAKYGYDNEFPADQVPFIEAQGLSQEWALKYWYAHWEIPSAQMGFDMLHRGIIDLDTLNDMLKVGDIPPFWRDKLLAIAYTPFTRVDVRRMHQLKVLTDDELLLSYMDIGYDYDKALKMVEFTKALNNEEQTNLTKAEIIKGYTERFITVDNARNMLTELKFSSEEIDYFLTYADYQADKDIQAKMIDIIKKQVVNRLMSISDARTKLATLNLQGAQIDVLITTWQLDLVIAMKDPTKAELEALVKANIITIEQYKVEMLQLGYQSKYVNWYATLLIPKPKETK